MIASRQRGMNAHARILEFASEEREQSQHAEALLSPVEVLWQQMLNLSNRPHECVDFDIVADAAGLDSLASEFTVERAETSTKMFHSSDCPRIGPATAGDISTNSEKPGRTTNESIERALRDLVAEHADFKVDPAADGSLNNR